MKSKIKKYPKAVSRSFTAISVAAVLGLSSVTNAASNTQGGLVGHSLDASGKVIAGVSVMVRNLKTGLKRTVISDEVGAYRFNLLPAGKYKVIGQQDGIVKTDPVIFSVNIGQNTSIDLTLESDDIEIIEVHGRAIAMVDVASAESVMLIDSETISRLPIARDLTSVALLAPGVNQGDSAFEGDSSLASFGGASVGENAYYINGLNATNFRNGLGGSQVPFEFYDQFEIKSGGYGAEFGRSTGGVVTAITKSGGNESEFGLSAFYEPDVFAKDKPNVYGADGEVVQVNNHDEVDNFDFNVYSSGAIIQDKLFYYLLLNPTKKTSQYNSWILGQTNFYEEESKSLFWGVNIDWYINDDNFLELTAFSDERENDIITSNWDSSTETASNPAPSKESRGGLNLALQYTSNITDDLQISALLGLNKADRTDSSEFDASCPWIYDSRQGGTVKMGCWATDNVVVADDERRAFRLDIDYHLGDHALRFGVDVEKNLIDNIEGYSGGGRYYRYYTAGEEGAFDGAIAAGESYYRLRERHSNGSFDTITSALYLEDTWQVTDDLVLTLGLRNETFDNKNIEGDSFIKVTSQWAPRVGFSWDISGDGESKLFAHIGRYYLPVAANTNLRLAGAEFYTERYFALDGLDANSLPTNDTSEQTENATTDISSQLEATTVFDDGEMADTRSIVDANIEPMYQDEIILGYQMQVFDNWTLGLRGTYRSLETSIEDIAIDAGLQRYADEHSGVDLGLGGFDYYVLTNPGNDMTVTVDSDGDGDIEEITLTAEQLGYPKAKRQYAAIDFTFNRQWDGVWMLAGSYTWSHSWGNSEGAVRSDNGQDDAGLTTNFDQPGLTDGASGNLPNDRRHQFKLFGGYSITDNVLLGMNFNWQTGRPRSAFGYHPNDEFAQAYDSESFYQNGQRVPRGSLGNQPSYWDIDINAKYLMTFGGADVVLSLDVFNVFNNDTVRQTYEVADSEDEGFVGIGQQLADPYYGLPDNFQAPRFVRLSTSVKF